MSGVGTLASPAVAITEPRQRATQASPQTCDKFVISERLVMLTQKTTALEFSRKDERIAALLELVEKIDDLKSLNDLAEWDQNTLLPDGAGGTRGNQMATIQSVLHEYRPNQSHGQLIA